MTDPVPLAPPPRAVRSVGPLRRRRLWGTTVVIFVTIVGWVWLGLTTARRVALIRFGERTEGTVVRHHITPNRIPRFTLFVRLSTRWNGKVVPVSVDSETYDRTWIGDRATFYLVPTDPENTTEDPPSALKTVGFILGCVLIGALPLTSVLFTVYELTSEQKEERRLLIELAGGTLAVTESRPSVTVPSVSVVSGSYTDPSERRYRTENLQVPGAIAVGERIPVLIDFEAKTIRAVATLKNFEPARATTKARLV